VKINEGRHGTHCCGIGILTNTDIARGGSRRSHATPDSRARGPTRDGRLHDTINSTLTLIFRTPDIRNTLSPHLAPTSLSPPHAMHDS
jgi:hypothetical protein